MRDVGLAWFFAGLLLSCSIVLASFSNGTIVAGDRTFLLVVFCFAWASLLHVIENCK